MSVGAGCSPRWPWPVSARRVSSGRSFSQRSLRPAAPLTAMVVILWVSFMGTVARGFTDPTALVGRTRGARRRRGQATSWPSRWASSPRLSCFASLRVRASRGSGGALIAWDCRAQFVPRVFEVAWPWISRDSAAPWVFNVIGGEPNPVLGRLGLHVVRDSRSMTR